MNNVIEGEFGSTKKYTSISRGNSKFNYITVSLPVHLGSRFEIFKNEENLENLDINSLLFNLNSIFLEECNNFRDFSMVASKMIAYFDEKEINLTEKVYTKSGAFNKEVEKFIIKEVSSLIESIFGISDLVN